MDSVKQILDYREFGAVYRDSSTIEDMIFTNRFFANPETTWSDKVEVVNVTAINTPGKMNIRSGPPRIVQPTDLGSQSFTILRQSDEMPLPADALQAVREPDSQAMQQKGRFIVQENVRKFGRQAALFKEVAIASIIQKGRLNVKADGTLLTPSVHATTGVITDHADAQVIADYGQPTSRRGNLGGIIDAYWDVADTDIDKHLSAIKIAARKAGSMQPNTIYINEEDKWNLKRNTQFKTWAQYNSMRVDDVLRGDGIDGLWGFNWRFVNQYYNDEDGTAQPIIPSKCGLLTPPDGDWHRAFNGVEPVFIDPSNYFATMDQAVGALTFMEGQIAYAMIKSGPPVTLSAFYTDNWGVGLADPNAVWTPRLFT